MGKRSGISKRLGEKINRAMCKFDSDCKFAGLNSDILEKWAPEEVTLTRKLINGGIEQLFTTIEGHSFDIGFITGYAVAKMHDIPDQRFKVVVEDMKKLITDQEALSQT